jgi:DNA primase
MVFEKKNEMHEKYLKGPPCWIIGTINRELNLFELCSNEMVDDLHDQHNMALAYWR